MPLDTFRYQIVYDIRDSSGALLTFAQELLPDGATLPEFRLGDPWRVTFSNGKAADGIITAALKNLIITDPRNHVVQYDFTITTKGPARSLDPALLGLWATPDGMILIEPDGWSYSVGNSPATLSADGQTLTDAGTPFTRRLGTGPGIEGVWGAILTSGGSTFDEERHFRSDGTFTTQTTKDGAFDSLTFGTYTWRNDILAIRERRAIVTTGPGNAIHFDVPFGPDLAGTYGFTGPDTWELTLGATTLTYTRA